MRSICSDARTHKASGMRVPQVTSPHRSSTSLSLLILALPLHHQARGAHRSQAIDVSRSSGVSA
eukprot:4076465-Pleurochrysis_carterae.AAC.1